MREVTSFADCFVLCSGTNTRQIQAIADEIHLQLKKLGAKLTELTDAQARYIGVAPAGPYKSDQYRY